MKFTIDTLKAAFDDDLEITVAVAESLFSSSDDLHASLAFALKVGSHVEIKRSIHAMKGALSVFGESTLYTKVKLIDQQLKINPDFLSDPSLQTVPEEFILLVQEIKEVIAPYLKEKS